MTTGNLTLWAGYAMVEIVVCNNKPNVVLGLPFFVQQTFAKWDVCSTGHLANRNESLSNGTFV